ncbi:MAG TPA: glycosyltransferase family 9 protein [Pseudonocardia sp.]|nr:glycosyltransferase family 9 protein [Pseudonocardia sp.]
MPLLENVRRIAVLRCNAVGDHLMATPALTALRAAYPGTEITLLGAPWHERFLTGRPGPVDRVDVLPIVDGLAGQPADAPPAAELPAFLDAARARRFDLAVQIHGGGARSNPLVKELGARCTIGLRAPGAPPLDRTVPYRYYQSEVARFLEVVALVGAAGPPEYPPLAVTARERAAAAELLPGDGPWIAVHAGATDPRRRWAPERFAEVVHRLVDDGARVALSGTRDDPGAAAVRRLLRVPVAADHHVDTGDAARPAVLTAPEPVVDLAGRTDLGVLAAVLQRCAVVVSNDTGPLHLARAVGVATVGLYWCGNAINAAPATRTRHRPLLSWTVHCPECGVDCTPAGHPHRLGAGCAHRPSFLGQIPVAEVLEEVRDLLAT